MQAAQKTSNAGALYLFCIGLFLTALGAGFFWLMFKSFGNASDTRKWVETPCLIIVSESKPRSIDGIVKEYQWQVSYKFQFKGEDLISDKYKPRGQRWRKSVDKVKPMIQEYPVGSQTVCYVNPERVADPETPQQAYDAILAHDTKAAGYTLWFPALFSIGGIGICVGAVRAFLKN